jgi:hypothetical protein
MQKSYIYRDRKRGTPKDFQPHKGENKIKIEVMNHEEVE